MSLATAILELVPDDGSTIGNNRLRSLLAEQGHAVDEATYAAERDALISAGTLAKGRGRGGSVRRATGEQTTPAKPATQASANKKSKPPMAQKKQSTPAKKVPRRTALKKSELYSTLWSSCDELRGGMDASQYKDYVLVLLFIKYISDKYAGQPFAPIQIPKGASFADMVQLKGKSDIGDQINKTILAPLATANKLADFPDFNDAAKLGSGKEMVDRLSNLIGIFENPALDFSSNAACSVESVSHCLSMATSSAASASLAGCVPSSGVTSPGAAWGWG